MPKIRRILQTLHDVGLGYVPLGQSAPTLSGGEAQRVKLAAELARPDTGKTLYILDEPTTGLHFDDVRKLLDVVHRLADLGNTVVVIEHNLDVIKTADWVIDLGPEAGRRGGELVAAGPPEAVAEAKGSHTGAILKAVLAAGPHAERPRFDPKAAARQGPGRGRRRPALEELTDAVKPPWEVDGRRWHTRDRVARNGRPARWDGRILERVVDRIHELGDVRPDRLVAARQRPDRRPRAGRPRLLPRDDRREWVVTLRFFVPRNTFKPEALRTPARPDAVPRGPDPRPQRRRAPDRRRRQGGRPRRSPSPATPPPTSRPPPSTPSSPGRGVVPADGQAGALVAASELG